MLRWAYLAALLIIVAAVHVAQERPPPHVWTHVCINASGQMPPKAAVSVYRDGEGFEPIAVYIEGEYIPVVYPNYAGGPFYTVVIPQRPGKICLDLPISRAAPQAVIRAAENYAKASAALFKVAADGGAAYVLIENREPDIPP